MADKKLKIIGITISITWLSFISLAIFLKALGEVVGSWFSRNSLLILIISGIAVLLFIIIGAISFSSMLSKRKGFS